MKIAFLLFVLGSLGGSVPDTSRASLNDTPGRYEFEQFTEKFRIGEPWNTLEDSSAWIRKYRGMIAYIVQRLERNQEETNVFFDLLRVESTSQEDSIATRKTRIDPLNLVELATITKALMKGEDYLLSQQGQHYAAIYSTADGSGQLILVGIPEGYDSHRSYPLVLRVQANIPLEAIKQDSILQVYVSGRTVLGMAALAEYEVLTALDYMKTYYPVDPGRVCIFGNSAGASTAMIVASRHPDLFACALPRVAFGNHSRLENLGHIPIICEHGLLDWTSAICNVRVITKELLNLGYPMHLIEYPSDAHSIKKPYRRMDGWIRAQFRPEKPARITFATENIHNSDGAYWIRIQRMQDLHEVARVTASVALKGNQQDLYLSLTNVSGLEIQLDKAPVSLDEAIRVQLNNEFIEINPPVPPHIFFSYVQGKWTLATGRRQGTLTVRRYQAGGAANLYNGQPLLIVYGTQASEGRVELLKNVASTLSRYGGASYSPMATGQFPVKADHQVSLLDMQRYNLILVGTHKENLVINRFLSSLPFDINEHNELNAGNRETLDLSQNVLSFIYYNPEATERLIYGVMPYGDDEVIEAWMKDCAEFLPGSDGIYMQSQPDLVVQSFDRIQKRHMQYDRRWQWRLDRGHDIRVSQYASERPGVALAYMKVMRQKSGADFAMWWGPEDKRFYNHDFNPIAAHDPHSFTLADLATWRHPIGIMSGRIPGQDLIEIQQKWVTSGEMVFFPALNLEDIDPDENYTVVIPRDFVYSLGRRQKLLYDVEAVPAITVQEVIRSLMP